MLRRITVPVLGAAVLVLALPGVAAARGITGTGPTPASFLRSGFEHMLLGWDHLLFVAGVLILAGNGHRAAKLISLFALGHSTTLIAATLAGWRVNASVVDAMIALSAVFVGAVGLRGRPQHWPWLGDRTELLWAAPAATVPKWFYGPEETAPDDAFAYVITEGYVVVEYTPRLSGTQVDRLRDFVAARDRIAAGASQGQAEPLKAVTGYGTLTCPRFDLASLGYFVDRWSKDPRSQPFQ